jgi:hypothetical protein
MIKRSRVDEGHLGPAAHGLDPQLELAFPEHPHHDWKPSMGLIKRFSLPWSFSSRLLRYFTCGSLWIIL